MVLVRNCTHLDAAGDGLRLLHHRNATIEAAFGSTKQLIIAWWQVDW